MVKLSAVIITYNEEKNIDRCLESLKLVADEIVVVDSLSTDRTQEICFSHNVIVIEQPFLGYKEQKNFAISKASYPNVLSLDADEALSEKLSESILNEKRKGFPADGYTMNRLNYYCGKWIRHGTYYPDRKLRLLNKKKGIWGGRNPHDTIIMQKSAVVRHLRGDLLHYTYQSAAEHARKTEIFSSIAAQSLFDEGIKPFYFKMYINSSWAFLRSYFVKLGFLDGREGFRIARFTAWRSFLKYKKLNSLYNKSHKTNAGKF